jgi:hypothetical protein
MRRLVEWEDGWTEVGRFDGWSWWMEWKRGKEL